MSETQNIQSYVAEHPDLYLTEPDSPEMGYQAWEPGNTQELGEILAPHETNELERSQVAFESSLDALSEEVPEIAARQEAIKVWGGQLIHEFGIDEKLFDKPHSFFFAALADRYARANSSESDKTETERAAEKEFVADALMLLARDKSRHYDQLKESMGELDYSAAHEKRVYNRFTNEQVTADLKDALNQGGLLDEARKRMGITPENEDPFVLRVLNVTTTGAEDGMRPTEREDLKDYEAYSKGLRQNTAEFAAALGGRGVGVAWNQTLDGVRYLVVPLPIAEKLLYKEAQGSDFSDVIRKRDVGVLEHEYVHTQGGVNLDRLSYYGIGAEEVRAEQLSGNRNGYQDVKILIDDLSVAANFNIRSIFETAPKGGTAESFYTTLASKIGLQNTLEFALIKPTIYSTDVPAESPQGRIATQLSGDALIERVYEQSMTNSDKAQQITARIQRIANTWRRSFDGGGTSIYYREQAGLKFLTTKITQEIERLEQAE